MPKQKSSEGVIYLKIKTHEGEFLAGYSSKGLCRLRFPSNKARVTVGESGDQLPLETRTWHNATCDALARALQGKSSATLPPLDLSSGTEFQQKVWRALRTIADGQTRSYGEIARAIGKAKAVRAVGAACGANPIAVLVPCHRVLAANQRLGGFSADPKWKRLLLQREGAKFL